VAVYGGPYFLPLNKTNREAAGVAAVDVIEVDLQADEDIRSVDSPPTWPRLWKARGRHKRIKYEDLGGDYFARRNDAEARKRSLNPSARSARPARYGGVGRVNASPPSDPRQGPVRRVPLRFSFVSVLLAFLRLSTRPGLFPHPLTAAEAVRVVELWLSSPAAVVLNPSDRHLALLTGLLTESGTAANLVNDAHLATLALEHGAEVVSFDRDFARFAGIRWSVPGS